MSRSPKRLVVPAGFLRPGEFSLPDDLARYVVSVLRLGPQTKVVLADGAGQEADGVISVASKREVVVSVAAMRTVERTGPKVTLLQGLAKGDKMDRVVRQVTELGVSRVVPVITERAVNRLEGREARWHTIAEDAVRVSGRPFRPELVAVTSYEDALLIPADLALVLALDGAAALGPWLRARAPSLVPERVTVLIGPEGGLTPNEVTQAIDAGFVSVHLGSYTLRTETAGPAVVAILGAHWTF